MKKFPISNFQFPINYPISKFSNSKTNWRLAIGDWKLASAYTLIEILIAISILALLFAFGFASFRDFSRRQAVVGIGRSLRADLRLAQASALAGNKPDSTITNYTRCVSPNVLNGYNFNASSGSYTIEANCSPPFGNNVTVKTVSLSGITLSVTPSGANPILFKALGHGTNVTSDVTITLSQTGTTNTETVTVTAGGEIK